VIFLEGSEEFIRQKIKELPEEIISGSHWTEEGMARRLALFK
jgi:hypothetical protein